MSSVFEQVVAITEDYLGPAARRFVARQISFHFDKRPDEIALEDIPRLAEWTRVTLSLLTEDNRTLEQYSAAMTNLALSSSTA